MIRRGPHSCSRSAQVTLGGDTYDVMYKIHGKCYYDSGRLTGPPEDCYPPEGGAEISAIELTEVTLDSSPVELTLPFKTLIINELEKLPLGDYLYESWIESDFD